MDMRKFQYKFLSKELVRDSKTKKIVFLNPGIDTKGKWGDAAVFLVEIDSIQTEYTPNSASVTNLGNVWGFDSNKWIGKVADVSIESKDGKEFIIAKPGNL
jgi:hypothetical protein